MVVSIVNENTVLIGHSCGCVFLVHYLNEHRVKVKGLITASGYNNFFSGDKTMDELNESFYIDSSSINLSNYVSNIVSFYGNNDPYIPQIYLSQFASYIGGKSIVVSNAGHFNSSAGYTKFDTILEELMKMKWCHKFSTHYVVESNQLFGLLRFVLFDILAFGKIHEKSCLP